MADTVDHKTVYPASRSYLAGVISHILLNTHDTFSCSFPDDSDGKESSAMQETRLYSWMGKIPCRREWLPTSVFLPGKSLGQSSLTGNGPWDHKKLDTTE